MAYSKRNRLYRIRDIQEIVREKYAEGLSYTKIYQLYIKDKYHISKRTFDEYLGINPWRELEELEKAEQAKKNKKKHDTGNKD